jgi:pyruvyl transferase EpsI
MDAKEMSLRQLIPLRWKREVLRLISPFEAPADFPADGPRLIVALAADYANLGDVAITRALVRFAGRHLPSHRPYLLCAGRVFRNLRGVARAAATEDVVAIVGGGNMGDRYPDLEEARCHVVRAFRRNRIVSFPQSFDFSETPGGRHFLRRSRAAYASHPRLRLFARERESFRRMQDAFPDCRLGMAPDSVLSLDLAPAAKRDLPLLICFRDDLETRLDSARRAAVVKALRDFAAGVVVTDTVLPGPRLAFPEYEQHLDALLADFARATCVVTDRLHGLIFSVISGTPCVVLENNNHKIRSTCETWLSRLPSVRLLADPEPAAVIAAVQEVSKIQPAPAPLNGAFTPLADALRA